MNIGNLEFLNFPPWLVTVLLLILVIAEIIRYGSQLFGFISDRFFGIKTKYTKRKEREDAIISNQETIKSLTERFEKNTEIIFETLDNDRQNSIKYDKELRTEVLDLKSVLDEIKAEQLEAKVNNMRQNILDFASHLTAGRVYTAEQYRWILKLYVDYEDCISKNNLTNDEVNISYEIIKEYYAKNLMEHSFADAKYTINAIGGDINE